MATTLRFCFLTGNDNKSYNIIMCTSFLPGHSSFHPSIHLYIPQQPQMMNLIQISYDQTLERFFKVRNFVHRRKYNSFTGIPQSYPLYKPFLNSPSYDCAVDAQTILPLKH